MGTCMSKDKKGATVAHTACVSSSQDKHLGQERENTISPTKSEENFENLPSLLDRPSEDDCKEVISTDKHVVEIRLPIASPNKYKASPASATLAVRAMASIARPAEEDISGEGGLDVEEEDDEERGANSASNVGKSSPPLFYSSYLSGASFSRDLAAFTRDIASLSCSPLKRSPSVNGAHDLIAAAIKAAHMSPQYSEVSKFHANMANDDYSNTTRSRSLPKRFYGKGTQNASLHAAAPPALLHKRSSSRDAVCINSVTLSPRLSVRRVEASGEFRVCARQAAARRPAAPTFIQQPQAPVSSSRVKERSPLSRRSCSTGKVPADAGHTTADNTLRFRENRTSSLQPVNTRDKSTGRVVLKEKSTNCVPWVDVSSNSSLRDRKKAVAETKVVKDGRDNFGIDRFGGSDKELLHQGSHTKKAQFEYTKSPLCCAGKRYNVDSDTSAMYPASVQRVHSLIQALAEMNIESSLLSEHDESETEVEGELDLIQFAFDARLSPKKDLEGQQARDLLLKEAAIDAFGRPSFHSNIHPVGLQEAKQPSSALMSMRLPSSEADTSKIREVLKLLSDAESEMGTEQKTLFHNQLRIVLDALKTQTFATENTSQEATKVASNITASSLTSRANSWPRSIKEPTHIDMSVDSTSFKEALNCSVHEESSLEVVKPIQSHKIAIDQEQIPPELLVASCETAQALEISKCKGLDSDKPGLKPCLSDEENGHVAEQADESFNAGLLSGQVGQVDQEVMEGHCGVENAEEPHAQIHYGHDSNYFADLNHYEIGQAKNDEVAGCSLSDYMEGEDCTKVAEGLPSALIEVENIYSCCELQIEGKERTAEGEDMFDLHDLFQQGCASCLGNASPQRSMQATVKSSVTLLKEGGCGRSEDAGSDGSFEFRMRSSVSTPSTPMLSTPSTPRHFNQMVMAAPLNAQEIAEIWQAFD